MLLPDNIHPNLCLYYTASLILSALEKNTNQTIQELYLEIRRNEEMSFSLFVLSLDWLYLIQAAQIDERGIVKKCL